MTLNRAFTLPRLWRLFCSTFIVAAAIAALAAISSSCATSQGSSPEETTIASKIAPWEVEHTASGQQAELVVVLADQDDLSGAAGLATKTDKGRLASDALRKK